MNLPLSAFNSPFPLSTSKTIAFLETSEREERQWTHVYEKYRDVCRAMLEKRYPEWTMYAEDAVSAAFAKIARNNKTFVIRNRTRVRRVLTVLCCHEIIRIVRPQRSNGWSKFAFWWVAFRTAPRRKDRQELWKESCLIAADTLESPAFENGRGHDWIKPADRDVWLRLVGGMSETEIAAEDARSGSSVSRAKKRVVKWILREAEKTYRDLLR